MRYLKSWHHILLLTLIFSFFVPGSLYAQQAGNLNVATAVISKNIVDRQPVEPGSNFSTSVGRLYCYTKITNIQTSTQVFHVWYFGDIERARVALNVNPPAWRTYSSKIIQAHEIGKWHVKILDAANNLLKDVEFELTP